LEETKTDESKPNNNSKHKKLSLTVLAIVIIIGAATLFFYLRYKATHITTDDAFIEGDIHTIASRIKGSVIKVHVASNQFVKKGAVLVELDPADYEVKLLEARAGLNAERAKMAEIGAKIESANRQIDEFGARANAIQGFLEMQEAKLQQAEMDLKRMENLYKKEVISKERYEKTQTAYKEALAQVKAASEGTKFGTLSTDTQKATLKQAETARITQASAIKQKEAMLREAELKYGYTKIYAPVDGYVTKKSVEAGNQIDVAQPLMAVVPRDVGDLHITANYKETQLEKIKTGQKVSFRVDAFPGKTFNGKVDSIMSGTGAVFSLFPPENATGNYVKVVQRIPVKIVLDKDTDKEHVLRIGMSVVPTILVE
jgi:membrane fusion protein (multidrug efflux system)